MDDVIRDLCIFSYVPQGKHGKETILVGGDRLTEAASRNIQKTFADAATPDLRLQGMLFKFEDWHAIRNLYEVRESKYSTHYSEYRMIITDVI